MLVHLFQAEVRGVLNETGTEPGYFFFFFLLALPALVMRSGPRGGGKWGLLLYKGPRVTPRGRGESQTLICVLRRTSSSGPRRAE